MKDDLLREYFFAEGSNVVNIELKLSNEVTDVEKDKLINSLMLSLSKSVELVPGAVVSQIYFGGRSPEDVLNTLKENLIEELTKIITTTDGK